MEQARLFLAAWLPLITAVVGWLVTRYSKPDTTIPLNVPARLRPWIPIGLSIVLGAVQKFVLGAALEEALRTAIIGGLTPILAHELVSESMLGGKEIPVPFMVKKPPISTAISTLSLWVIALWCFIVAGCGWWTESKTAASEKAAAEVVQCATTAYLANPSITPEELAAKCGPLAVLDAGKILVAMKRVHGGNVGACPSSSASSKP